jgi:SAM-dependent methyltransferase
VSASGAVPYLARLLDFAEPGPGDVCLDVSYGPGALAAELAPRVRHLTAVDAASAADRTTPDLRVRPRRAARSGSRTPTVLFAATPATGVRIPGASTLRADARSLPCRDDAFSLVTCRTSLHRLADPEAGLREMLRVCRPGGRLIIADLIRHNLGTGDRDRIERMRDPGHPATTSIARLVELVTHAGADVRRLDVFTAELPVDAWLGEAAGTPAADEIRAALLHEVDGGPRTGARPRLIGGELWLTQTWIHLAAQPL